MSLFSGYEEPEDTKRLNFLAECGVVKFEREYDPFLDSPTHGYTGRIQIFTIDSQHVTGDNFRDAIDKAMKRAKEIRCIRKDGGNDEV